MNWHARVPGKPGWYWCKKRGEEDSDTRPARVVTYRDSRRAPCVDVFFEDRQVYDPLEDGYVFGDEIPSPFPLDPLP